MFLIFSDFSDLGVDLIKLDLESKTLRSFSRMKAVKSETESLRRREYRICIQMYGKILAFNWYRVSVPKADLQPREKSPLLARLSSQANLAPNKALDKL